MSAIVIVRYQGDTARFEELLQAKTSDFRAIAQQKRERGCISHRYVVRDGELLVIDEWPTDSADNYLWQSEQPVVQLVREAGLENPPEVSYFHSVHDPGEF
jgi:hypothetical protein